MGQERIVTALAQADALRLPLADDSVDLVVTSPPYFALRSYQDGDEHYDGQIGSEATPQEFLEALWAATTEMVRVVKPSGSIFVNLGDKYAGSGGHNNAGVGGTGRGPSTYTKASGHARPKSLMGLPWRYAIGCIDTLGLILRSEMIWSKPNGLPESVTDRVRRSHEQWFHFTLEPRYFSAIDEIRVPHKGGGEGVTTEERKEAGWAPNRGVATGTQPMMTFAGHPLGKLPGSVWSIPSEPLQVPDHLGVDHFAAFPQEWPRRLILGWCPAQVCSECGQGRAPVVDKTLEQVNQTTHAKTRRAAALGQEARTAHGRASDNVSRESATITGYACACPDTSAPSTPGVVLDPFAGTGTTVMVARALGRTGIGVDLSADYLRLANWRVFHSGHATKTMERTNQERQGALL
jgi:DNA modification methylase